MISFSCDKCAEAPYIKDSLGCEKPLETAAAWLGEGELFYSCPIKFILPNTYELIEKMDSYKNGIATPPDFEKQSAKFLSGVKAYNYYLAKSNAIKKGE